MILIKIVEMLSIIAITYLVYFLFIAIRKEQLKKFKNNTFYKYLIKVYKLDPKKHDMKNMVKIIGLANGFIIAITYEIVLCVKGLTLQLLMSFAVFILLDLIIYHIVGKILKGRE
ncbi:MAG: hypothetical protein J6G98_04665 [Bacilli bacterium]|nr:hypothetical protein [Bacilli bacterium]